MSSWGPSGSLAQTRSEMASGWSWWSLFSPSKARRSSLSLPPAATQLRLPRLCTARQLRVAADLCRRHGELARWPSETEVSVASPSVRVLVGSRRPVPFSSVLRIALLKIYGATLLSCRDGSSLVVVGIVAVACRLNLPPGSVWFGKHPESSRAEWFCSGAWWFPPWMPFASRGTSLLHCRRWSRYGFPRACELLFLSITLRSEPDRVENSLVPSLCITDNWNPGHCRYML